MTIRVRSLLIAATFGAGLIGLAPSATANIFDPRVSASGGRGACVAVDNVDGWCVVNPFDDLPKPPKVPRLP